MRSLPIRHFVTSDNNIDKALELCDITIMQLEELKRIAFV
jgi:hypothetical protein